MTTVTSGQMIAAQKTVKLKMSTTLKQYVARFGHIVGTKFTQSELPEMENLAQTYKKAYWDNFDEMSKKQRDSK